MCVLKVGKLWCWAKQQERTSLKWKSKQEGLDALHKISYTGESKS